MNIKPIKTETDYTSALQAVGKLMSARKDTPEGDKLDVLVTLIEAYEEMSRISKDEYRNAVEVMDDFIGKKGFFRPCLSIEKNGKYIKTTNIELPKLSKLKKVRMFGYRLLDNNLILTNPQFIADELDEEFSKSKYCKG